MDKTNISKHFSNIIQEGELEEKEVSMSSKKLFGGNIKFSEKYSLNSKKGVVFNTFLYCALMA